MTTYIPKLVGYLKAFRKSKTKTKDLLRMLKEWDEDFNKEAIYGNHIDYNKAKNKYILMRWNDWEIEKEPKRTKMIGGSYEDEHSGMYY